MQEQTKDNGKYVPLEFKEEYSPVAKLIWSYMQYTPCKIDGDDTTIIEIKHVWSLINDIEGILREKQDTIDLNIKTNMDLVKTIQRIINESTDRLGLDCGTGK